MSSAMDCEWERIYALAVAADAGRRGDPVGEAQLERLARLQAEVQQLRAGDPWQPFARDHGLMVVDQEIAACALAPEIEPRIGWLFHQLQPGQREPWPTPALIQELLALEPGEGGTIRGRLGLDKPLLRDRLISWPSGELYSPIRSTPSLRRQLLGLPQLGDRRIPGATQVHEPGSWDELVLPARQIARLREITHWVVHREQVEAWGMKIRGGPVVLFSGPPGTGKTLAAEGLARELGRPVYRVDLGLLVSKYVGETEKNLNALFDAAASVDALLLFDEADSLFGRRGEVRDARDRYANMEISHLLSRLEQHPGICVLTTNSRENLDPAFFRRLHFVIEFPLPGADDRRRLWELHLPPAPARSATLQLDEVAATIALTGGQIRNASLQAAFLAAAEGGAIERRHLAAAVHHELAKHGMEVLPRSLGSLARHLEDTP